MILRKIENWNRQEETILRIDKQGNIIEDRIIKRNEEAVIQDKRKELTSQQKAIVRNRNELKDYTGELGGYIHMCYISNEILFNNINIDKANISRLIMMATFIDYNNREENLLVLYGRNNKITPMTRKDVQYKLKLSDAPFKKFMSEMKKLNIVYEINKKIYLSIDYFSKGKSSFENKNYTRIFIDTTRMLYEGCSPRQHKQLSYVFQLIPFIHYENNILCSNPNEKDMRRCDKLSLLKICELLNISTDSSNMSKFENDLLKFSIVYNEEKYHIFKRIIIKGGNGKFDYFVINPQIIWAGNNIEEVRQTINKCFFIENIK